MQRIVLENRFKVVKFYDVSSESGNNIMKKYNDVISGYS